MRNGSRYSVEAGASEPWAVSESIGQKVGAPALVGASGDCHRRPCGGRRFRILAIVDDFTRKCLALVPDTSLPALRVVRELDC